MSDEEKQAQKTCDEQNRNGANRNPYSGPLAILITFSCFAICVLAFISLLCLPENSSPPPLQFFLTTLLALLVFDAIVLQILVSNNQWKAMQDGLKKTQAIIGVAERQFELTDRPWLGVDVAITGPLTFTEEGASFKFKFTARNVGRSVAVNTTINPRIVIPTIEDGMWGRVLAEQTKVCNNLLADFLSYVVFPTQIHETEITFNVPPAELEKGQLPQSTLINVYLVGCVDYQISGHARHHQTRFIYEIYHATAEAPNIPLIPQNGENVPVERLILRKSIMAGADFAD